ncbi:MAG: sporulation inhibitor of replication protein SirA [Bacillaceae bacterium]|nr:sporulation inhibitor of replication protein SirA [Bacillaceae bacterium]
MRHFHIYLIEEEVAKQYYGREAKIYQLFQEYEQNIKLKPLISKQIDFITQTIPAFKLQKVMESNLKNRNDYEGQMYKHSIWLPNSRSAASISIFETYIELTATGSFEAETIFFEILRKENPFYMAIDIRSERFGWLFPIKQRKFV